MNLKDKRTKRVCAMSASVAVIVGGGVVLANGASAAGSFALAPNVTAFTTLDLGSQITGGNLDQDLADATFGIRANATIQGDYKLVLESYTPAGTSNEYQPGSSFVVAGANGNVTPALDIAQIAASGLTGPGSAWSEVSLNNGNVNAVQGVSANLDSAKETYVTANAPGTYKFHFVDTGLSGGDADDAVSPTVTATVLDSEGVTAATADDWAPAVSGTNGSVDVGAPLSVSVTLPSVTSADVRSTNNGVGVLLSRLASLVGIKFTGSSSALNGDLSAGGYTTYATGSLRDSVVTRSVPVGVVAHTGTVVGEAAFDATGSGSWTSGTNLGSTSASLTDNDVTAVNLGLAAGQDDDVSTTGTTRLVRKGTATVKLESKATLSNSASAGSRTVYYTFSNFVGGLTAADLTVNGQPLPASGSIAVTTDATTNVATLNVTSSKTDTGYGYTVSTSSNGQMATSSLAFRYEAAAATTITSAGSYSQTVGGSVTIRGSLLDQWGKLFTPAAGTQATLNVKRNETGNVGSSPDYSRTVDVVDGVFSTTYSDIAGNSTPRTDAYSWTVGSGSSAVTNTTSGHVLWLRSVAAGSATFSSLGGVTSFPLASNTAPFAVATHSATNAVTLKGTLKDTSGAALPFVNFALTATPGVYFIDADGKAQTTLTGRTTSTGQLSVDGDHEGVDVFFTKAAADTNITLSAGDLKVETGAFTVQQAAGANNGDAYNVTANDVTTEAGAYTILSGNVTDAFGNPVANEDVTVTVDKDATGVITSSAIRTDANGRWTAVYLAGVNDPSPKYTVTIASGPYKAADYLTTGLRLPAGVASATGTITVTVDRITVSAPKRVSAGYVTISGKAKPGAKVAVFAMTGGRHQVGSAVADTDTGVWSVRVYVSRNTAFQAETSTAVSNAVVVHVKSTVKLSVKRYKSGVAKVTVTGGPSKSGTITLYATHGIKNGKVVLRATTTKSVLVKSGKGYTTYRALFTATGCDSSSLVSVRVKL